MDYYNEKPNSWLHKRQAPATGNTNTNIQPFPNSPPSPNNNSTSPENAAKSGGGGGGISKSQLTGIIAGVLIVLFILIGIFLRRKLVRERTRNAIRIDDIEWDSRLPKKTIRLQQQSRGVVYNERDREGEKIMSSMVVQNSPTGSQFSNFYSPRETPSDPNISSPVGSKFNQSRRFQQPENGPYHHLPRSPRSPLMFRNKTSADSDYDDEDTLKGTPRSPYFFKDDSVPKITNDQYADDEIGKAVPLAPPPPIYNNNNYNNVNISNENRAEYTYSNIKKRNDIISQLDSDLDNIITTFQDVGDNNNHLDRQYDQYTNDLPPSFVNPNDNTLALSLPSPFKLSWTKDSSYFNNSLLAPITSTNEESNRPNSQSTITSTYSDSESRSNSIGIKGTNQNVQMDYVQPNQGMIQIEMIDDHIITKNEMLKESIRTNEFEQEPEFEFFSPHSMQPYAEPNMDVEYVGFEQEPEFEFVSPRSVQPYAEPNMDVEYVDNESRQIVEPYDISNVQPLTIQPIETNMKTEKMYPEISAPVITGAAKPETLASKPIVTSVGPRSISPMYDIDSIRRHAEKVLNKKNVNKGGTAVNEIKKNDKNESSNEEPQEKTIVRKKSVRFQAGPANEEAPKGSNANEESSEGSNFATRKSILINRDDAINIQDTIQRSSLESDDEEANNRDSASSYQMYDFDISSYQDNRF